MTSNGVMAVTLRYFTEFGKHNIPTHNRRVELWRHLCRSLLYFVARVRCRRKESSRSLSHLLMSFLYCVLIHCANQQNICRTICHITIVCAWRTVMQPAGCSPVIGLAGCHMLCKCDSEVLNLWTAHHWQIQGGQSGHGPVNPSWF